MVESTISDETHSINTEKMRQYRQSAVQDTVKHDSPLEVVRYFKGLDKLVACEQKRRVKIYNLVRSRNRMRLWRTAGLR